MKIITALTDSRRKSISFITDEFKIITLKDAVKIAKDGNIEGVHTVKRGDTTYIRTNPSIERTNIDSMSVPWYWLVDGSLNILQMQKIPVLKTFWEYYQEYLKVEVERGETIVSIDGWYLSTRKHVQETLLPYRKHIFAAAKHYDIDPYLLGAIFIDEIVRLAPFENVAESIVATRINKDVSVGVAQVKIETARKLIIAGYYNPNPKDKNLKKGNVESISRSYLYEYISNHKHNVFFGAARIKNLLDEWHSEVGVLKPEIVTTLYHMRYKTPHDAPGANERGLQIIREFYPLAVEVLKT